MYKHPSLSGVPALLLLPFLPTLQEHKFLAIASFAGVHRARGLHRNTCIVRGRNIQAGQF